MSYTCLQSRLVSKQRNWMGNGVEQGEEGRRLMSPTHSVISMCEGYGTGSNNKLKPNQEKLGMYTINSSSSSSISSSSTQHKGREPGEGYGKGHMDIDNSSISSISTSMSIMKQDCESNSSSRDVHTNNISTPDLLDALYSMIGDNDDEDDEQVQTDGNIRFDTKHDTDLVSWDRMDHLMNTHEYGTWMARF